MSSEGPRFIVWGCRGSLPVPQVEMQVYGGDTTCFQIIAPDGRSLIIDCGSGMRRLGEHVLAAGPITEIDVLLTHCHFDHLIGLGFFRPLVSRRTSLRVWSTEGETAITAALEQLYSPPLWPVVVPKEYGVSVQEMPQAGAEVAGMTVIPFALNHPGGCTGYRVTVAGKVICVVTDHEHGQADIDAGVLRMATGADLLVYDAAYSEAEYAIKHGWGHSTWEEGLRVAARAGARHTLLVHHAPHTTDATLDAAADRLRPGNPPFAFARDGMEVPL